MLLLVAVVICVASVLGSVPAYDPKCTPRSDIGDACVYGNLSVTLLTKTLYPKDCNGLVNVKEFTNPPKIHINSTNATDRFTVVMIDLGPQGRGPEYLEWMITNVSTMSLKHLNQISQLNILAAYQQPLIMHGQIHQTLIQILVFRHQNVLRVPFGELYVTLRRNFSFRQLFSNISPNLRLCGPVAGVQYWVTSEDYTPGALPAPFPAQGQPIVPPGQAPVYPVPYPGQSPVYPASSYPSDQHQHPYTTFHKKSSGSVSQPIHLLFVTMAILTVVCV